MKFECPQCQQKLAATPAAAGSMVRCPSCNNRFEVPKPTAEMLEEAAPAAAAGKKSPAVKTPGAKLKTERQAWKETDPTNPSFVKSLGIGIIVVVVWFLLMLPFNPPATKTPAEYNTMQFLASLFYKHFAVSFLNTMFFTWAMAIIVLKRQKIRHQKAALLLDVLPTNLGREIEVQNVGLFIEHVYSLPVTLRDSLMVNRIRKALELFEIRPHIDDVREMMVSQSEIDSARIGGSYTLVRAFLWGIPLLGFIGTVIGLSHAIGGMNFANVEDIEKIIGAINNVTSGLGTAFDATLLGLVLALTLNFPLNALAKQEDDNLHSIDAFCNEVLLPRLREPVAAGAADTAAIADSVVRGIAGTQQQFLADLNQLARQMNDYATNLDQRMNAFQQTVTKEFVAKNDDLRAQTAKTVRESLEQVTKYLAGLESGIASLNKALAALGEKQVVVNPPKKRGWFGRG